MSVKSKRTVEYPNASRWMASFIFCGLSVKLYRVLSDFPLFNPRYRRPVSIQWSEGKHTCFPPC
jgi:hypothetical protein